MEKHAPTSCTALAALLVACAPTAAAPTGGQPTPAADRSSYRAPPEDQAPPRVELAAVVPEEIAHIPRWEAEQFGVPRPATTFRPADQPTPPLGWDRRELASAVPGPETWVGYHGHGCCGGCQTVALLGAVVAAARRASDEPAPRRQTLPHRPAVPPRDDELDLRTIFGTARQAFITGGRDIPSVAPSLALVGAVRRSTLDPLMADDRSDWYPARICQALAGKGVPVVRARVREHDVRFTTVALRDGPVIVSGAFNRLVRGDDDIYRCAEDATDMKRHHFVLVVGFELNDRDLDGEPDEVVWLVRDDHERRGGDDDTWHDGFLEDEWWRMVPRGCLLDRGRAHSLVPGTLEAGTFDDALLPGPEGRVSFCEADPDGDGVPTTRDGCPYWPDPDGTDSDDDGVGDACDPCPELPPASVHRPGHWDEDGDGLADACDPCPETPDPSCEVPGGGGDG